MTTIRSLTLTAATALTLLGAGAITASPARAFGAQCWYEQSLMPLLNFNCNLIARDQLGRYIYLCCR